MLINAQLAFDPDDNADIVAMLPNDIHTFANFRTFQCDRFLYRHAGSGITARAGVAVAFGATGWSGCREDAQD
jgi:hypothetical protein